MIFFFVFFVLPLWLLLGAATVYVGGVTPSDYAAFSLSSIALACILVGWIKAVIALEDWWESR